MLVLRGVFPPFSQTSKNHCPVTAAGFVANLLQPLVGWIGLSTSVPGKAPQETHSNSNKKRWHDMNHDID